jgi:hypothetical protein
MEERKMAPDGVKENRSPDAWWTERNIAQKVLIVIGFAVLGAAALFFFGWIVMLLWNWLMPDIFGLKPVSYWQAWGLLLLSTILFGRLGGSNSGSEGKSDRRRKKELKKYMRDECEKGESEAVEPKPERNS